MVAPQTVGVGIIGGGLMGREAAAALARWPALIDHPVRPRLVAVCDLSPAALNAFDAVPMRTADRQELLANSAVDVVYAAVRHDQHEAVYRDVLDAGKDLFAEKPFGIDETAARSVLEAIDRSGAFVRVSSELPFYPGAQLAFRMLRAGDLGRIIEGASWFSHSSDLDLAKPVNWKRQQVYCGAAGVMNDLGLHAWHLPLRLGWRPTSVDAVLQDLVPTRPGPDGTPVPCDTYENATLFCRVGPEPWPLSVSTRRIDPGQMNNWGLRVTGMAGGVAFSTRYPRTVQVQRTVDGQQQVWQEVETGSQSVWPTVTGGIFEVGFSDAYLQMWAAFLAERAGQLGDRFGCATPEEALGTHQIFTAALRSHETGATVPLAASSTLGRRSSALG